MTAKPTVPPKPKDLLPRRKSGGVPSTTVFSQEPIISSPFASSSHQDPQFFYTPNNTFRSYLETRNSSTSKTSKTSVPRRISLPDGVVHSVSKSISNLEGIGKKVQYETSTSKFYAKNGQSPQRDEVATGKVAETKRRLLNRVAKPNNGNDGIIDGIPDSVQMKQHTVCHGRLSEQAAAVVVQVEVDKKIHSLEERADKEAILMTETGLPKSDQEIERSNSFDELMDPKELDMGQESQQNEETFSTDDERNVLDGDSVSSDSEKSDIVQGNDGGLNHQEAPLSRTPKAQNIAAEIVSSERDYLQSLKLLLVDFPAAVQGTIPPEEVTLLFKGLPEIQTFTEDLLHDLQCHLERYPESREIAPVFLKKGKYLILYVAYVKDFERMIDTYRALMKKYPNFSDMVHNFEKSPACKMLPLVEYFHKPIQRLPRYPLLLGTYLRALEEGHPDRENAKRALDLVADVTAKANTTLASVEKVSRLLWYQARTIGYTFLRCNRTFIRDGVLKKLSRKAPQERVVLLCSDALICGEFDSFSKFTVNAEYALTDIKVELLDGDYFNRDLEFGVYSTKKSSVFRAASMDDRNSWMSAICRAIEDTQKLRIRRPVLCDKGESMKSVSFAPIWIPDYRVRACQLCKKSFNSLFRRYHHCRTCGYAVCHHCSQHEVAVEYKDHRAKRVCDKCFTNMKSTDEKFSPSLPTPVR